MLRLLKIEWNKIYYYKTARIFTIIYFAMLVVMGLILSQIKPEIGGMELDISKLGTFNFPVVWHNITFLAAIAKIFLAVIIITNITNEYSNRTLKQNLIDGLSKKEFLASKLLSNTVLAIVSTIFVFVITISLGLYFTEDKTTLYKGIEFVGAYFLKLMFFFTFCTFLSLLVRKSAFAFLALIVWWMVEGVISSVEFLIRGLIYKEVPDPYSFYFTNFLPLNASSKLIDLPSIKLEGFVMGGSVFNVKSLNWEFVLVVIIYTVVFTILSYRVLKRRDL